MNKELFKKSNKIEKITFVFDFLAIFIYAMLFLTLFKMLALPEVVDGRMNLDNLQFMTPTYEFLNRTLDKYQMNTIISLLVLFILVAFPMFIINIKKLKNRTIYEINSYTATSKFIQSIINLLSFNPFSAALRMYNMFILIEFVKGYKPKEFLRVYIQPLRIN